MARSPRLHVAGGYYHVILRGNHREVIFRAPEDRTRLSELVAEVIGLHSMRVHAICWMPNHVHLLIEVSDTPLGPAMMCIASRFARTVQWRRETTGHLFERRYRAILVDSERYLCELLRYIHLNPVRAGLVADPADYEWSGHRAYLGLATWTWLTTDKGLSRFGDSVESSREAYRRFVLEGIGAEPDSQLSRGRADDPRVLGDDRFVEATAALAGAPAASTIDALISHLCLQYGASLAALHGPGRRRDIARLRALVVHHALVRRLATVSQLARRFGRSPSTLTESLAHYRQKMPELFERSPGPSITE